MRYLSHLKLVAVSILMTVAFVRPALAQTCGMPSVGNPVYTHDENGNGTVSVSFSFPSVASGNYVQLWIDNVATYIYYPATQSGTWTFSLSSTCWATGDHLLGSLAVSCGQWQDPNKKTDGLTHVDINTTPNVSGFTFTPSPSGQGTLRVNYTFPNTADPSQRWLQLWIDNVQGSPIYMPTQTGTYETTVNTSCWPTGTHYIDVLGVACNNWGNALFKDNDGGPIPIDTTPKVEAFTASVNDGVIDLTAHYEFPNTASPDDRWLQLWVDGVQGSVMHQAERSGTWTGSIPIGCMTGTHSIQLLGVSCNKWSDPLYKDFESQSFTIPDEHIVDVATRRLSPSQARAIVNYTAPAGSTGWKIRLDLLPWVDENGNTVAGSLIGEYPLPSRTGSLPVDFNTPTSTRQFFVKATLISCRGERSDEAAVECCSCEEAPSCTNDPVAFSDGNMRYRDADLLPPMMTGALSRTYDSSQQARGSFGRGWTSMFDSRLKAVSSGGVDLVYFIGASNEATIFRKAGGTFVQQWPTGVRALGTLQLDATNGLYIHRAANAASLSLFRTSDGRFVGSRAAGTGRETQISYDASGLPVSVSDSWSGLTWTITTDATKRRITSIVVAGRPDLGWTYQYDASDNLQSILAPGGGPWRTYSYVNNRMTAARDAAGRLIESHDYDSSGRAINSTGPTDEIASIVYDLPGPQSGDTITRVTTHAGQVSDYLLRPQGGGFRTVKVTGGCTSCGSRDAVYAYDASGRVTRKQQADGYITVTSYANDRLVSRSGPYRPAGCDPESSPTHCRLDEVTIVTTALEPTTQAMTTSFEYNDTNWPDRPTAVVTPSIANSGQSRREESQYAPLTGDAVVQKIRGWTIQSRASDGTVLTRALSDRSTVTALYGDAQNDRVPAFDPGGSFQSAWMALPQPLLSRKSVDGPRTDVTDVTSFVYYPIDSSVSAQLRGRLAAVENAAGHRTRYESYDVFGNPTRIVDPNGVATEMTYDTLGRLATQTIRGVSPCDTAADPLCGTDLTTTRTYHPAAGPLESEQRPGGGVTVYDYDGRGRMQAISRGPSFSDLREQIAYEYDSLTGTRSLEKALARDGGSWVEKKRESFAYDPFGQLQTVTHADATSVTYAYDDSGRISSVRDENHAVANTLYAYDPAGRMSKVKQSIGGAFIQTLYAYDLHGNLVAVTDPNGNATSYEFDDFGQLSLQQSPVTGTTVYFYDIAGNLTSSTDANGATTTRAYDKLGRPLSSTALRSGTSESVSWSYDDATSGRFAIGRLASMSDPSGSTTYAYERRGLLREHKQTIEAMTYTTSYAYDVNGNRRQVRYPTGLVVDYTFDFADRPASARSPFATYVGSVKREPFGPLTEVRYGNGTIATRSYDARYRMLTNRLTLAGAVPLADYAYTYDPAGNVTQIADGLSSTYTRTFTYDDLNRLKTAVAPGLWGNGSYTYDAMGNLTTSSFRSASFNLVNPTPKLQSVVENSATRNVTYDSAGNETTVGASAFTYSPRSSLASGDNFQYIYDGRGLRTITTGPSTTRRYFLYTPELQLLAESSYTTSAYRRIQYQYIWFDGLPVAQLDAPGTLRANVRWTFPDHLGTPILLTDQTGTAWWRAEYEPYGAVYQLRTPTRHQPLRLPGQEAEQLTTDNANGDTERSYNIFRWYRAGWGRYTQDDPVSRYTARTQAYYAYADDNPARFIDPEGLYTVGGSCARCEDPFQPLHRSGNLSQYILDETSRFCRTRLNQIRNVSLRRCIEEHCRSGRVECKMCEEGGELGDSSAPLLMAIPALRRIFPVRTATVCLNISLNYTGEAGNTVIHEWAHGCGYNPDNNDLPGIPGIPNVPPPPPRVIHRRGRR